MCLACFATRTVTLPKPLIAPPLGAHDALPEDYNALIQLYGVVALRLIAVQAWSVRERSGKPPPTDQTGTRREREVTRVTSKTGE